jgi:Zn-dependent protease with chaperone function
MASINIDRIFKVAINDAKVQGIINRNLALNKTMVSWNGVVGKKFKGKSGDPPAFSLGINFLGVALGFIFISEEFSTLLNEKELEFVVLHELGHIIYNHNVLSFIVQIFKAGIIELVAEVLGITLKQAQNLIGVIKAFYMIFSRKKTIEEEITAQKEFQADEYAVIWQQTSLPAISVLSKIVGGKLQTPTHFTKDGTFTLPAVSAAERIQRIKNIPLKRELDFIYHN